MHGDIGIVDLSEKRAFEIKNEYDEEFKYYRHLWEEWGNYG